MPRKKSKRRSPGDGSLFERKDGMWVGSVEIHSADGRRRQKRVYASSYAKAKQKLDQLQDDVAVGVVVTNTTTVGKWLTYWLDNIRGPKVRPSTRQFYEEAIRLHLTPHLGAKRLDRLTPHDVRVAIDLIGTSRNRQRAHQVLRMALGDAVTEGLIRRNVTDAVDKPGHRPNDRGALDAGTAQLIIRTAIASGDEMAATRWAATFLTGARPGELLGLRWSYVDLDRGLVELAWQLQELDQEHGCGEPPTCGRERPGWCPQRRWRVNPDFEFEPCHGRLAFTRPKTKAGTRVVPLIPPLLASLRQLAGRQVYNPHGLVWHHPDGRPISPGDSREEWQQLLRAAGLVRKIGDDRWEQGPPPYVGRHTTATLLQAAGVDEQTRMQIMGQSSVAAHRGYVHVDQTLTRRALGSLAELMAPREPD